MLKNIGTVQLETPRLILRRFNINDPLKENTLKNHLDNYKDNGYDWAVVLKSTGELIGNVGLKIVSDYHDVVEVRYGIAPNCQNKGLATEMLKRIIDFVFDEIGANRIQGICTVSNIASKRVLEKNGMVQEGLLAKYGKVSDGYEDCYIYAIIKNSKFLGDI